ncbi:DNA circularization N-terminal domain-containing protein, partial [Achromobacter xylosoxidans]|uniref:DNA circularization N-terminal domain-containing protein n=3 Tax=Betaproteobacteria TaxID=28216 RepID=UPI001F0EA3B6
KDTLLDASFKGVGFDVIDDTLRGTHALAEHEYPFVQGSDIEDTGVSAMDMSLTAVLWGDDYESRLQSLLGVLRETGAGELIHPIYGSVPDCVVADFEAAHNEENPDYCTVRMTFKQSVKAAPFFDRELPSALADEIDWLADLASWQGFEVFQTAL